MKAVKFLFTLCVAFSILSCETTKKEEKENLSLQTSVYKGKLSNGKIERIDSFPSKYVRPRNVDIWLPDNYSSSEKYAVLYMHDGQMLFDSTSTWNKQEWKVDEIVGDLISKNEIKNTIVVAMWNHSDIRHTDYYPQKPFDLLPKKFKDSIFNVSSKQFGTDFKGLQSDNYLKFIVEEVKPYIDANYSVYTNAENTFVAGSSMGGLISMYAICEYPNVFGGAACLSTHWIGFMPQDNTPVPESFFSYMNQKLPSAKTHKIYFDYGTETLDRYYLPYQHRVDEVLNLKGYTNENSRNLEFVGQDHSENSWNKRFQVPVQFLLKK